ncbi:MAG: hypothetical protein QY309_11825 [Cyclobacteriaceae bacterium]|nr:MAG: hypothetical protein QY309_11825 [Cyclobacteriaceae bacterium]
MSQCNEEMVVAVEFPDDKFLMALIDQNVDKNGDGIISHYEAQVITSLDVSDYGITDLRGIEAFVNLDTLLCGFNSLSRLDVPAITGLVYLSCSRNQIKTLDVSGLVSLRRLYCEGNELSALDVSTNSALELLFCQENELQEIDVQNNSALKMLYCQHNLLSSLDCSNNSALQVLRCHNNLLENLNVSNCGSLFQLFCHNNPNRPTNNQLVNLDISSNTALISIQLTSLPTLQQVCVWQTPFPPDGVSVNTSLSPNVYFATDCN